MKRKYIIFALFILVLFAAVRVSLGSVSGALTPAATCESAEEALADESLEDEVSFLESGNESPRLERAESFWAAALVRKGPGFFSYAAQPFSVKTVSFLLEQFNHSPPVQA